MEYLDKGRIEGFKKVIRQSLQDPEEMAKKERQRLARLEELETINKSVIERVKGVVVLLEENDLMSGKDDKRSDYIPAGRVDGHPGIAASIRVVAYHHHFSQTVAFDLKLECPSDPTTYSDEVYFMSFHNDRVTMRGDKGSYPVSPRNEEWKLVEECVSIVEDYAQSQIQSTDQQVPDDDPRTSPLTNEC